MKHKKIHFNIFLITLLIQLGMSEEKIKQYMKPIDEFSIENPGDDPTVKKNTIDDKVGKKLRANSKAKLDELGFAFSKSLPTLNNRAAISGNLRPVSEAKSRLLCFFSVISWVCYSEESLSSNTIIQLIKKHNLNDELTDDEKKLLQTPRSKAFELHSNQIGWKMENMLAISWALGFDTKLSPTQGMAQGEKIKSMMSFAYKAIKEPDSFKNNIKYITEASIQANEDLFYCAHNAVRSAQLGHPNNVPENFHPIGDGGVVHELRHALTWLLSPGVKWTKTDLST